MTSELIRKCQWISNLFPEWLTPVHFERDIQLNGLCMSLRGYILPRIIPTLYGTVTAVSRVVGIENKVVILSLRGTGMRQSVTDAVGWKLKAKISPPRS